MPRPRAGYIAKDKKTGKWIARVTYTDQTGRRKNVTRKLDDKSEARKALKKLLSKLEDVEASGGTFNDKTTFTQLADKYQETYLVPAKYVGDKKVSGLRSYKSQLLRIKRLRDYFYKTPVKSITYSTIEQFKLTLLDTPTPYKRPRSIADVNRFLSLLRSILKFAVREGLINRDPFTTGKPLICASDEVKREHILSKPEELRLLEAARKHSEGCFVVGKVLVPAIISAIDTGLRRLELLSLEWRDVDFSAGVISIRALNAKTLRERVVPLTARVRKELLALKPPDSKDGDLVFNVQGKSLYNAMTSARDAAGLSFVRMTDFRHTFCSRLAQAGLPIAEVARLAGHSKVETTFRYIQSDSTTIERAAVILDNINADSCTPTKEETP